MIVDRIASIVIVNFNGKHFLPACLNAIAAQTLPEESYEVIVSDNGSTDGSLELLTNDFPWVHVIENGSNLGFAAGNNVAFELARGKYLVGLNNDTAPSPDWLERFIKAAEENPRAGIINGHSRLFYDQLIIKLESESFIPGGLDTRLLGVMVSAVETGADRGTIQYLDGFYGWEEYMGDHCRWSNGNATLGVPVPSGMDGWTLTIKLTAFRPNNQPVHVWLKIGDELFGEWNINGQAPQDCAVQIPADARLLAEPLVQNAGSIMDRDGYGKDRGTYSKNNEMFFEVDRGQYQSEPIFAACGANILIRREMLEEIGGFDDRFFMYYEDTDLSWRAWASGWKVFYTNEAIIRHIHCGSSQEWSSFFIFHTNRNRLAMLLKNGNTRQIFFNWGQYIFVTGRNTLGLLKAVLRRAPESRAIRRQLLIRYRVIISLMSWLPLLIWQRIRIYQRLSGDTDGIKKWTAVYEKWSCRK